MQFSYYAVFGPWLFALALFQRRKSTVLQELWFGLPRVWGRSLLYHLVTLRQKKATEDGTQPNWQHGFLLPSNTCEKYFDCTVTGRVLRDKPTNPGVVRWIFTPWANPHPHTLSRYLFTCSLFRSSHVFVILTPIISLHLQDAIYTNVADVLISVNPYKSIPLLYEVPLQQMQDEPNDEFEESDGEGEVGLGSQQDTEFIHCTIPISPTARTSKSTRFLSERTPPFPLGCPPCASCSLYNLKKEFF